MINAFLKRWSNKGWKYDHHQTVSMIIIDLKAWSWCSHRLSTADSLSLGIKTRFSGSKRGLDWQFGLFEAGKMIMVVSFERLQLYQAILVCIGGAILTKVDLTLSVFYWAFNMCPAWKDDQDFGYAFQFWTKVPIYRRFGPQLSGYLCAKPLSDLHSP